VRSPSNPNSRNPESAASLTLSVIAALGLIALPAGYVAWLHLGSPNLWFDESGQYWLARGLHHFSAPNSPSGGWTQMLEFGRVFNSDPGSFTLLLRGWIAVFGDSPTALRSLPFLFFLLTPGLIFAGARRVGASALLAALAASTPLGFTMLLQYSTEIRAYSMEACAVTWLFFVPCWLNRESTWPRVTLLGIVSAILLTSRYSGFFFGAAACAATVFPLRPLGSAARRVLCFSIPCAVAVASGFLLFARYQAGGTQRPPAYVEAFMLKGKTSVEILSQASDNFLSKEALPITAFLVLAPLFVWLGPRALCKLRAVIGHTVVFTAIAVVFAIAASLAGKLPWAVHTRWSIGYQALAACCLSMIVIACGSCLALWTKPLLGRILAAIATCAAVCVWVVKTNHTIHAERPYYETIASHLEQLRQVPNPAGLHFFVQSGASPTVRYLCEVGSLRGVFAYPKNFHFETGLEAKDASPINAGEFDYVVLTHFSAVERYRPRIVGGSSVLISAPQPSCLLLIKK